MPSFPPPSLERSLQPRGRRTGITGAQQQVHAGGDQRGSSSRAGNGFEKGCCGVSLGRGIVGGWQGFVTQSLCLSMGVRPPYTAVFLYGHRSDSLTELQTEPRRREYRTWQQCVSRHRSLHTPWGGVTTGPSLEASARIFSRRAEATGPTASPKIQV